MLFGVMQQNHQNLTKNAADKATLHQHQLLIAELGNHNKDFISTESCKKMFELYWGSCHMLHQQQLKQEYNAIRHETVERGNMLAKGEMPRPDDAYRTYVYAHNLNEKAKQQLQALDGRLAASKLSNDQKAFIYNDARGFANNAAQLYNYAYNQYATINQKAGQQQAAQIQQHQTKVKNQAQPQPHIRGNPYARYDIDNRFSQKNTQTNNQHMQLTSKDVEKIVNKCEKLCNKARKPKDLDRIQKAAISDLNKSIAKQGKKASAAKLKEYNHAINRIEDAVNNKRESFPQQRGVSAQVCK